MALEVLKSAYDGVKERLQNPFSVRNATPFAGTFLITFVLYNWKLFYTLFNFDPEDTRADKIDIIQSYISGMNFWERVGCPLFWAFFSIIFYYLFNNLSLGITVFFNRWVRGYILHFTDRGMVIPRVQYDRTTKRLNSLKNQNDKLEKESIEMHSAIKKYEGQITEYNIQKNNTDDQLAQKDKNLNRLEGDIRRLKSQQDEFKVLYARYGKWDEFIDVTKKVQDDLFINRLITINNETFSEDPCINQVKELFVLYSIYGDAKNFTVIEGEKVTRDINNMIMVEETDESKKNKEEIYAREMLADLFKGIWILRYENAEKESISQCITVDRFGRYFVDGSQYNAFTLVEVSIDGEKLGFTKALEDGVVYVKETLNKTKKKTFEGVDSKGRRIVYSKYK